MIFSGWISHAVVHFIGITRRSSARKRLSMLNWSRGPVSEALIVESLPRDVQTVLLLRTAPLPFFERALAGLAGRSVIEHRQPPLGRRWGRHSLLSGPFRRDVRLADAIVSISAGASGSGLENVRSLARLCRLPHYTWTSADRIIAWRRFPAATVPSPQKGRRRIVLDAREISLNLHGGVRTVEIEMIRHLVLDDSCEWWALGCSATTPPELSGLPLHWYPLWAPYQHPEESRRLGQAVRAIAPALYHSFYGALPERKSLPIVSTLYDTIQNELVEDYPPATSQARYELLRATRSDRLVAISQWTADCCARVFGVDPGVITVAHPGVIVPERVEPLGDAALLFSHSAARYKNARLVVEAYRHLARSGVTPPRLLVVGTLPPHLLDRLDEPLRAHFIEQLGPVAVEHMEAVWRRTRFLVAPSHVEGFDMPTAEAMARGIPVLASDIPVHREVLGEWGVFFSPESPVELAALLARPPQPSDRGVGRTRSARFSWRQAADRYRTIYSELIAARRR